MTTNPTTPKRWRPRFSLRTLVVLITLVCCYAACWGPTKTKGVRDAFEHVRGPQSRFYFRAHPSPAKAIVPLIVSMDQEWWMAPRPKRHYFV